jgi:hypothetical protein
LKIMRVQVSRLVKIQIVLSIGMLASVELSTGCSGFSTATATPVIQSATGTYTYNPTLSITDATPGASIYYTTDGSTPSATGANFAALYRFDAVGSFPERDRQRRGDLGEQRKRRGVCCLLNQPAADPSAGTIPRARRLSYCAYCHHYRYRSKRIDLRHDERHSADHIVNALHRAGQYSGDRKPAGGGHIDGIGIRRRQPSSRRHLYHSRPAHALVGIRNLLHDAGGALPVVTPSASGANTQLSPIPNPKLAVDTIYPMSTIEDITFDKFGLNH